MSTVPALADHNDCVDEPKHPAGTPEHEAYAGELRAELAKFAAGEPPYEHDPDILDLIHRYGEACRQTMLPTQEKSAARDAGELFEQIAQRLNPPVDPVMEARRGLIDGLRELADWYEQHPDVPLPRYPDLLHSVGGQDDAQGVAEVEQLAVALGTEVKYGAHTGTERQFAGLRFRAYYIARESMAEYDRRRAQLAELVSAEAATADAG